MCLTDMWSKSQQFLRIIFWLAGLLRSKPRENWKPERSVFLMFFSDPVSRPVRTTKKGVSRMIFVVISHTISREKLTWLFFECVWGCLLETLPFIHTPHRQCCFLTLRMGKDKYAVLAFVPTEWLTFIVSHAIYRE